MIRYISTRGLNEPKSFEDVLLAGMAPDGGLYVPEMWPQLSADNLRGLQGAPYGEVAVRVMYPFVEGCIPEQDFRSMVVEAYGPEIFNHRAVTPLVELGPNLWSMEMHRGPTLAFKDVAMQLLGRLFDYVLDKRGERVTIVGATSGDTGSAAIEACKTCENIDIFILHPKGRVSEVQRRQMTTVIADNVFNLAIEGTFDDCQKLVKDMFADEDFRTSVNLSAVNSINWARIMAQIVYYVTGALALGAPDREVSFSVPTGNFGNIFAAYAARQMGVPIKKLAIATNRNDILTRFFETGRMERGDVEPSLSPSMDIQISSNFERYLFLLLERDHDKLRDVMQQFADTGSMELGDNLIQHARAEFSASRCSDEETLDIIRDVYQNTAEILDPHSAVGLSAARRVLDEDPATPMVNLACAHAAKFPDAVEKAIGQRPTLPQRMADLFDRPEQLNALPNDLSEVQNFVRGHASVAQKSAA